MPKSNAEAIEAVHLCFLTVLASRMDTSRYVLKGGANLRYFFHSPRYSEDIDLDLVGLDSPAVTSQIHKTLASGALQQLLKASGIYFSEEDITLQKDTGTTKRWRIFFQAQGILEPVRTKIEFSNRNGEERLASERVPEDIVAPYALRPALVQHYLGDAAVDQKVAALAGRTATQARDVFDLDLLLRKFPLADSSLDEQVRREAADAAVALDFSAFEAQVVPFLLPATAALYDRESWDSMQTYVVEELLS